jgi:adenylyl- and sulfurtransferase ThiI
VHEDRNRKRRVDMMKKKLRTKKMFTVEALRLNEEHSDSSIDLDDNADADVYNLENIKPKK